MSFHIGIAGPLASGKSTLARMLKAELELRRYTVAIVPLAEAVKEIVAQLPPGAGVLWHMMLAAATFLGYGYDSETAANAGALVAEAYASYYTPNEKPRKLLQIIGTEIGRQTISEDIWIRRVQARKITLGVDVVITDDIRFDNEARSVDFLIQLTTQLPIARAAHEANMAKYSQQYVDTAHISEHGITVRPDAEIPCGFKEAGISALMERITVWLPA